MVAKLEGSWAQRGPPPSLRKRRRKGSEKQEAAERPAQGHHLNQDPHHMGLLTSPKVNQQQSVNPERREQLRSNCSQLPLPFASLLLLSGWNNCGHEVALGEEVLNLFKCHSE